MNIHFFVNLTVGMSIFVVIRPVIPQVTSERFYCKCVLCRTVVTYNTVHEAACMEVTNTICDNII